MSEKSAYLSKYSIGRGNYEQLIYGDQSVTFYNEEMNICRELIDGDGHILNFPGVLYEEELIREYGKREIQPVVKYSASFKRCADGRFMMLWTIRPDGRFWMDSWGFGAEDEDAVCLYSYLDEKGIYTQPFQLHSIGSKRFIEKLEPQELLDHIYKAIRIEQNEKGLDLVIPCFFGTEEGELKLSFYSQEGFYYVHDNGCAIKQLKRNVGEKYQTVLGKVCHSMWLQDEKVLGCFCQRFYFMKYLQKLVFIAHGDLICDDLECEVYQKDSIDMDFDVSRAEIMDQEALLHELEDSIDVIYDKNRGLVLLVLMCYSLYSTTASFLIENLPDHKIRISDNAKGRIDGEFLEGFYWNHDEISLYLEYLSPILERFGGECIGNDISITADISGGDYISALFRFLNLAILLSELGQLIELPKL